MYEKKLTFSFNMFSFYKARIMRCLFLIELRYILTYVYLESCGILILSVSLFAHIWNIYLYIKASTNIISISILIRDKLIFFEIIFFYLQRKKENSFIFIFIIKEIFVSYGITCSDHRFLWFFILLLKLI